MWQHLNGCTSTPDKHTWLEKDIFKGHQFQSQNIAHSSWRPLYLWTPLQLLKVSAIHLSDSFKNNVITCKIQAHNFNVILRDLVICLRKWRSRSCSWSLVLWPLPAQHHHSFWRVTEVAGYQNMEDTIHDLGFSDSDVEEFVERPVWLTWRSFSSSFSPSWKTSTQKVWRLWETFWRVSWTWWKLRWMKWRSTGWSGEGAQWRGGRGRWCGGDCGWGWSVVWFSSDEESREDWASKEAA